MKHRKKHMKVVNGIRRGGMSTAKKIGIGVGTAAGAIALPIIATSILKAMFTQQLFFG